MPSPFPSSLIPQIKEIRDHLDNYPNVEIAMTTDKRMILKCPDGAIALTLSKELNALGYAAGIQPGRLSSAYYVQVAYQPASKRAA